MNKIEIPQEIITALNGNQNRIAIVSKLLEKKGQFVKITTRRPLNLLAKFKKEGKIGWKESIMQVRCGVEYNQITKVLEERAKTNKSEEPLQGRVWVQYPYILKSLSNNKLLFRFYTINNNFQPKVKYVIDGFEVQKEDLETYCLASEYRERDEEKTCFDLSIDSIEAIN